MPESEYVGRSHLHDEDIRAYEGKGRSSQHDIPHSQDEPLAYPPSGVIHGKVLLGQSFRLHSNTYAYRRACFIGPCYDAIAM